MIEWINNKIGTNFSEKDLSSIKDFSLIWNIFENKVCNNNCSVAKLTKRLNQIEFEPTEFDENLKYFKNRYVENGSLNKKFEHLNFRKNDKQELVKNVLLGNNTETSSIILALSIIVYRYRNNLFHGIKQMQFIAQQKGNFDNANSILINLLKYF